MKEYPSVSIVMPTYNQAQFIEQAIGSILGQLYPALELIVIDGGSTDGTLDIIKKYSDNISYWSSEPDSGPPAALNKGFQKSTGDILAWLNSDDFYLPQILPEVVRLLGNPSQAALVYGGCLFYDEADDQNSKEGRIFDCGVARTNTRGYLPPEFDRERLTYQDFVVQPSSFWTRTVYEQVGGLDEAISAAFDWDWFIRASQVCEFTPLKKPLSVFRFHDANITKTAGLRRSREIVQIVKNYASPDWSALYEDVLGHIESLISEGNTLAWANHGGTADKLRDLLPKQLFDKYDEDRIVLAFHNTYIPARPG